jgi:hypothetical protein
LVKNLDSEEANLIARVKTELEVFRVALDRCKGTSPDLISRLLGPRLTEEARLLDGPCGFDFGECDDHLVYWQPCAPGGESHIVLHFRDGKLVYARGWGE